MLGQAYCPRQTPTPASMSSCIFVFFAVKSLKLSTMPFPIKVCAICGEEFELKPDKPGFANRCPACSETESAESEAKGGKDVARRSTDKEANAARREAMRNLLYRKDS